MLLSLPTELVQRILLHLDVPTILSCRLVTRQLDETIQSSSVFQYLVACEAAGLVDNPHCNLSYPERLDALNRREDAWSTLCPQFTTSFSVTHDASTIYDLTAGAYLLGDTNLRDLHYCSLPSSPDDVTHWKTISGYGPNRNWEGIIIDMGMAVYEHDLLVNVISREVGQAGRYSLDLVLLQFSTGEFHPLARRSCIHVQRSPSWRPAIALEVVGDNLALIVNSRHETFPDKLFIFDWKTGRQRLLHQAAECAYASLVFVSPELLLVPNLLLTQFEVWSIPSEADQHPRQILGLRFPAVSKGHFILTLSCRGEPNPSVRNIPHAPPKPFRPSINDTIIIANLRLASFPGLIGAAFTLIMHRRSLLDTITKFTSNPRPQPFYQHNEVRMTYNADFRTPLPWSSFTNMGPQIDITAASRNETYSIAMVPWSEWGPPISRWFNADETQTKWITTSTAQRWAMLEPVGGDQRITIVDFNPCRLRRKDPPYMPGTFGVRERGEELDHDGVFAEDVKMELRCTVYTAPDLYRFDGLLMEEERLLGLNISEMGRVEKVTVFYFG